MIIDPVQALAQATGTFMEAAKSSVAPIPTVVPSLPEYQTASETGTRTLWYVASSLMSISSLADGRMLCFELCRDRPSQCQPYAL